MSQRCYYCRRQAVYLCDFVLTGPAERQKMQSAGMTGDEMLSATRTCDRPLCQEHRVNLGQVFFCGKDGGIVTEDYCPGHRYGNPY